MNIANMRREISYIYPNWKQVNRMPENQVYAIYRSLQQRGAFEKKVSRSGKELGYILPKEEPDPNYHQITIGEYLKEAR